MNTTNTGRPAGITGPIAQSVKDSIAEGSDNLWPWFLPNLATDHLLAMDAALFADESVRSRAA